MANAIKLKRSSVAGKAPQPADLTYGELAVNTADAKVYLKTAANSVIAINDWANIHNKPTYTNGDVGLANVTNDAQLKIASNLSDLASAATARTNLGLGTAAVANIGTSGDAVPKLNANNTFSGNQEIYDGASYIYFQLRRLGQKAPGVESNAIIDIGTGNGDARLLSADSTNNITRWIRVKNAGGALVTDSTGVEREIYHAGNTGTAVTANVTTSTTDTTAGRLLKVGDFGIGVSHGAITAGQAGGWYRLCTVSGVVSIYRGFSLRLFIGTQRSVGGEYILDITGDRNNTTTWVNPRTTLYRLNSLSGDTVKARVCWNSDGSAEVWIYWPAFYGCSVDFCLSPTVQSEVTLTPFTNAAGSDPTGTQLVQERLPVAIYHQNSILGTVSQASGIPTGAIIERGSNANGEYVRFADGTQICQRAFSGIPITTAAGSLFSSGSTAWTFPAGFNSSAVSLSLGVNWGGILLSSGDTQSSTATMFRLMSATSINPTNGPIITAVGRWY